MITSITRSIDLASFFYRFYRFRKPSSLALMGRRLEEIIQLNTSFPRSQYLLSHRGVIALKIPQNEEISGEGKTEIEKELVLLPIEEKQIGKA